MTLLTQALSFILAPFLLIGATIGGAIAPDDKLGASEAVPTTIAFFETTLASAITSSATSFTLTSATDADGTTLASSTYAFVIDEGSSNEEIVIADCTATACTNAVRGVSVRTGNSEVTALKKAHRRGASVKMTDAPILMLVARALRGEAIVNFTPDANYDLVTKTYVDTLALGTTTVPATATDDGLVELATGVEAASSTATGDSGSPLALHTGISTSSAPSTGSYVVVTGSDGNIADGFLASTSVTQYAVWKASTTVFTNTGTSTYTKPTGVKWIVVEIQGGGGGGRDDNGYGGAAGGYAKKTINASDLAASTQVVVGTAGSAGTGGADGTAGNPSSFGAHASSTGGAGGAAALNAAGTGIGGEINIYGQSGIKADGTASGGTGGSSRFGFGGSGNSAGNNAGSAAGYGAGGGNPASNTGQAGNGSQGIVIITEYF